MAKIRRGKSYNEIRSQLRRIQNLAEENGYRFTGGYGSKLYNGRSNRAVSIADRYINNIMKKTDGKFSYKRFSRRVYMGMNDG